MKALSDATANLFLPVGIQKTDRMDVDVDETGTKFNVRIYAEEPVRWPSHSASRKWTALVPEKKALKDFDDNWELAATDYTAELINGHWQPEQLTFTEDARQLYESILLQTQAQELTAELIARYKAEKFIPSGLRIAQHPTKPLAPYQLLAGHCAMMNDGFAFFMEQGTGKTPASIGTICAMAKEIHAEQGRMARVIVVAPKNVRQNWLREVENFCTVGGKVVVVRGGEAKRHTTVIEAMVPEEGCEFTVVVISYEMMQRSIGFLCKVPWDLGALDEAHFIKGPETLRSKAALRLRDACEKRIVLTGTPICNHVLDLYMQLEFLGRGFSGFMSWESFKDFYGVFDEGGGSGYAKLVGVQNLPFMKERLARLSLMISKKEAMPDLPDKVYDIIEVEMTARQAEVYEQVAAQLALEIEDEMEKSDNKAMTISNILVKLLRLTQITSGYVVWDEVCNPHTGEVLRERTVEYLGENPKLEALVELLKEKRPEEKTVVWACFVPDIMTIHERLEKEGIKHVVLYGGTSEADREEAMRSFNLDPTVKVFIGNQGAGGTGINLPGSDPSKWGTPEDLGTDADHTIYYVQDWSHPKRSQSEDRNHGRNRNRKQVRVTDLCVPETIDEDIRARVLKKRHAAMEIGDIREILQNVLKGVVRDV